MQDVVDYSRSTLVGNEKQIATGFLSLVTAHLPPEYRQSHIFTGLHSSGKSKTQKTLFEMLPEGAYVHFSGSSNKALIDDPALQSADTLTLRLQELEKVEDANEVVEIIKSMVEWDGEFVNGMPVSYTYTRSMRGEDVEKIHLPVVVASLTTASQKIEESLLSRMLEIPIDESKKLNEAVCMYHFGQTDIYYNGQKYMLDCDVDIRDRVRHFFDDMPYVDDFVAPEGAPKALLSLVDTNTSESRRHSQIISSLLFASALLNHEDRRIESDGVEDRIVLKGQDIYNVFALREILTTMVYHLDKTDVELIRIINRVDEYADVTTSHIFRELTSSDFSVSSKSTVRRRLNELEDKGLVDSDRGDGGKIWRRTELSLDVDTTNVDALVDDNNPVVCPFTGQRYGNIKEAFDKIARIEEKQQNLFEW